MPYVNTPDMQRQVQSNNPYMANAALNQLINAPQIDQLTLQQQMGAAQNQFQQAQFGAQSQLAGMDAGFARQMAGLQQQGIGLGRQSLGIQTAATGRAQNELGLSQKEAELGFHVQEEQLGRQHTRQVTQENSAEAASGSRFTHGSADNRQDIQKNYWNAAVMQGSRERSERQNYFERVLQLQDQMKNLGLQGKRYDLSSEEINARLQHQLGVSGIQQSLAGQQMGLSNLEMGYQDAGIEAQIGALELPFTPPPTTLGGAPQGHDPRTSGRRAGSGRWFS